MIHSLNLFFQTFLRPTKRSVEGERISYFEVMGISWSLHMLYALYSVVALYIGVVSYEYLSQSESFSHLLFQSITSTTQKISLMITLLQVIFYPFVFQFGFKFWTYIIKFYAQIFEYESESDIDLEVEEMLNTILTANIFLIVPVFGNFLSNITQAYYLFIGLRAKMGFTRAQAFLVLMTPLFLIFFLTILVVSYVTFLISLM